MKKLIPLIVLALSLTPILVGAQSSTSSQGNWEVEKPPISFPGGKLDLWQLMKKAALWLMNITVFVALVLVVYAGFLFATAGGDPNKTKKALNLIIYAFVGVAIALLAYLIVNFVLNFIIGTGAPTLSPFQPSDIQ